MNVKIVAIPVAIFLLSGCASTPRLLETPPVDVETSEGTVICQLYSRNINVWDRPVRRPDSMSYETAKKICLDEGKRLENNAGV